MWHIPIAWTIQYDEDSRRTCCVDVSGCCEFSVGNEESIGGVVIIEVFDEVSFVGVGFVDGKELIGGWSDDFYGFWKRFTFGMATYIYEKPKVNHNSEN